MKTTMRLLIALLMVGFLGTISLAESDGPGDGEGPRNHKRQRKQNGGPGDKMHGEKFCAAIDATPEQQEQLKQIWETHSQAMKNWRKENKGKLSDTRKALKEAKKSDDKEAIEAAKLKLKEINKSRKELHENLKEQLSEVLTKEQMQKMKKMRNRRDRDGHHKGPGMRKGPFGELNLTDEQKAEIKKLHEEAREKMESAKTREEKREIMENLRKKINNDVLTDEQRAKAKKHFRKMQKGRRDMFLKGIGATDEQKTKIEAIMKKAREEAKDKDPKECRKIMEAAREEIRKNVLTDEQRKKAREMRKQHRRGKDGPGSRRRRRRDDDDAPPPDED